MDHELAFLLVIGVLWVLIGGTVSRHIVRVFQKDISPKRTYVTQLLLLVSLPLWSLAMVPGFHAMDLFPERRIYLSVFIGGLIYWFLILYWCLRLSFFATAVLWLVNCLVTVGLLTASMPNITVAGVRALATKANGEMRSTGTALKDYKMATGALPLPVNEVSQPVEGHRIAIGGVDQSTKEVAIYYRGPSFVPDGLFEKVYDGPGPTDPFRRTDLGPYGYGAGPIQGTSAAFVPSSWGPDMESQAEQLEFLFLEEYWGDVDSFMADPEYMSLTYSPTNGLVSPGDLCRPVGRSKEYGKLNIP